MTQEILFFLFSHLSYGFVKQPLKPAAPSLLVTTKTEITSTTVLEAVVLYELNHMEAVDSQDTLSSDSGVPELLLSRGILHLLHLSFGGGVNSTHGCLGSLCHFYEGRN